MTCSKGPGLDSPPGQCSKDLVCYALPGRHNHAVLNIVCLRKGLINCKLQHVTHTSLPLLFVQQREQRASRDILGYDGKLAGVIQTRPHKLDDAGVIEATEDGDLSAEHVYI